MRIISLLLLLIVLVQSTANGHCPVGKETVIHNYFVSNTGSDKNRGSMDAPFKTLERALERSRKIKTGEVHIYLRGGEYNLRNTIVLTPKDGNQRKHLYVEAYGEEHVTLSGGQPIRCDWKKQSDGIYKTSVAVMNGRPEMMTVDGNLRILARYPDYDPDGERFNGTAADAVSVQRISRWKSPVGAYLHVMHPADWGDFHYVIESINADGTAKLKGGWQNNRPAEPSAENRMVENVLEELDSPAEWFYDNVGKELYYYPAAEDNLAAATIQLSRLKHLIEIRGTAENAARNIHLRGIDMTMTERTFMEEYEPLLRSDWTVYRGAAVVFEGTEDCSLESAELYNLGGNAVLFSSYNRNSKVCGCHIHDIGASAIMFIGDVSAVRSPCFNYNEHIDCDSLDTTPGPQNQLYPEACVASDNLIHDIGMYEKQTTGVEISMSRRIQVLHNTIYHTPRAAINIGDGTWGGHQIMDNDLFDTVRETGDHGSINSWGRDRFWHPDRGVMDDVAAKHPTFPYLDAIETTVIGHNRVRCDRGWDIDLDDGSSNYLIENNLCLQGGIKLREGFGRTVSNNIMVNSTFHPHVWFQNSQDIFTHNIVMGSYAPVSINEWGKMVDYNIFSTQSMLHDITAKYGTDTHSSALPLKFAAPEHGDYTVSGIPEDIFRNFPMDDFGVRSLHLRSLAQHPEFAMPEVDNTSDAPDAVVNWKGLSVKNLSTLGEQSATGMDTIRGVLVLKVNDEHSTLSNYVKPADVILAVNGEEVRSIQDLKEDEVRQISIFRNQKTITYAH